MTKWQRLKASLKPMGMRIATKLLPVIEDKLIPALEDKIIPFFIDLAEKIGGIITKFTELDPKMQTTIVAVTGLAVALGPALSGLGSMIGLLQQITRFSRHSSNGISGARC